MKIRTAFTALMVLVPTIVLAGENPIVGTWKIEVVRP